MTTLKRPTSVPRKVEAQRQVVVDVVARPDDGPVAGNQVVVDGGADAAGGVRRHEHRARERRQRREAAADAEARDQAAEVDADAGLHGDRLRPIGERILGDLGIEDAPAHHEIEGREEAQADGDPVLEDAAERHREDRADDGAVERVVRQAGAGLDIEDGGGEADRELARAGQREERRVGVDRLVAFGAGRAGGPERAGSRAEAEDVLGRGAGRARAEGERERGERATVPGHEATVDPVGGQAPDPGPRSARAPCDTVGDGGRAAWRS